MQHDTATYDRMSAALHWIIGIGILALGGLELFRHEFPRGHFIREGFKALHQPLGTILLVLIMIRVIWSLAFAIRPAHNSSWSVTAVAARMVHAALYVLMLAVPVLGLAYVFGSDKVIDFGIFEVAMPLKASIGSYAKTARWWHETLALSILALGLFHAAAALFHHYLLKDGLLRRMSLSRQQSFVERLTPAE